MRSLPTLLVFGLGFLLQACTGTVCLPSQECSSSTRPAGSLQQAAPASPQPSAGEKAVTSAPAPQASEPSKARSRVDSIMGKLGGPGVAINADAPMPQENRKASALTSGLIVNDTSLVKADPRPTKVRPKPSTPQATVPPPPAARPPATKPPVDSGGKPPAAGKPSGRTSGQTLSSSPPAALAAQGEPVPMPVATGVPTPLAPPK